MLWTMIFVVLIGVGAIVGTLLLGGKSDEDYSKATKANLSRLTLIYIVLCIGLLIGVTIYIIYT